MTACCSCATGPRTNRSDELRRHPEPARQRRQGSLPGLRLSLAGEQLYVARPLPGSAPARRSDPAGLAQDVRTLARRLLRDTALNICYG